MRTRNYTWDERIEQAEGLTLENLQADIDYFTPQNEPEYWENEYHQSKTPDQLLYDQETVRLNLDIYQKEMAKRQALMAPIVEDQPSDVYTPPDQVYTPPDQVYTPPDEVVQDPNPVVQDPNPVPVVEQPVYTPPIQDPNPSIPIGADPTTGNPIGPDPSPVQGGDLPPNYKTPVPAEDWLDYVLQPNDDLLPNQLERSGPIRRITPVSQLFNNPIGVPRQGVPSTAMGNALRAGRNGPVGGYQNG